MLMTKLSVLIVTDDRLYDGFFKLVSSLFQSCGQTIIDRSAPVSSAEL